MQEGRLVAAASEERFSRIKHDAGLPVSAFRYCLKRGSISIADIDLVAYYENPYTKADRQEWMISKGHPAGEIPPDPDMPEKEIREKLGFDGQILFFDHHSSHAASAFFFSGFEDAAIYTADGVGEWVTTSFGYGKGSSIQRISEVLFPHSLGLLYATITAFLGFMVNNGEYKVMGLAPYGKPLYLNKLRQLIKLKPDGQFELDQTYFSFVSGGAMYSPDLSDLLGIFPRKPESQLLQPHFDLARSVQALLEEVLLWQMNYLYQETGSKNLCMAGGVALNCVANSRILREGPFEKLFVQPAAGDAGGSIGAAVLAQIQTKGECQQDRLNHVYLGPCYTNDDVARFVGDTGIKALDFNDNETGFFQEVVTRLQQNEVIGWFQGSMEFGPRALGARSILANPMAPGMRDRINKMVKKRESFRPFAPSVLAEFASAHFDIDHDSPFMLETCKVKSPLSLPAITHIDGSARPQTVDENALPKYRKLLQAFYKATNCPMLLNTSFNIRGEPIVCSPADALICMMVSGLDALVIGNFVIDKKAIGNVRKSMLYTLIKATGSRQVDKNLYTFV